MTRWNYMFQNQSTYSVREGQALKQLSYKKQPTLQAASSAQPLAVQR